jgi:hypothetical protein
MSKFLQLASNNFDSYFNPKVVRKIELLLLRAAVFSFVLHLIIIFLGNHFNYFHNVQHSYLKAIYTPFSFILFYEVFLLVIIIPNSISEFIGKQFEVITLITLRSFFHDIADFNTHEIIDFKNPAFISLIYDLGASIVMLGLTIVYYKIYNKTNHTEIIRELNQFINIKKVVSLSMIIVLLILSVTSLFNWSIDMIEALRLNDRYPNPNTVFYEDFFSIMIFVDVLLLIISFTFHSSFFIIFRNASFIITTILLRMSLTIEKPMNYVIVIIGFLFAIASFFLYRFRYIHHKRDK